MERVHLASLLDDLPGLSGDPLPERSDPDYYRLRMDAGDKLRKEAGDHSALAALAIVRVAEMRERRIKEAAPADTGPVAYVFDSLKHPREEQILRNVYGPGFWLVSIVQDIEERKHNLSETLASQQGRFDGQSESQLAEGLIQRDEADPDAKHGQQVRDVFAAADFFLPVRRGEDWSKHVERFLQGVFDAPFLTPTSAEDAMRHAQAASLRSAALGRQVGAVIVPVQGDPYLLGTNEVPKPGGGQFREGDSPDFRDFRTGYDPNPTYVDRMLVEVFERLASAGYFTPERNKAGGARVLAEARQTSGDRPAVLDGTRVKSLIEFTRCLHAEQAAIVSAARTGVALAGATLYTTTFPCHECTKFIVGAGIVEVQYIEPYPKSMAGELYRDLIDAVPPMSKAANNSELERIPFRPFLGFGPGRYDEVFSAGRRRDGTLVIEHNKMLACPIGREWSGIGVKSQEDQVAVAFRLAIEQGARNAEHVAETSQKIDAQSMKSKESTTDSMPSPKVVGDSK
jgi:deoxycytidylate deaminase